MRKITAIALVLFLLFNVLGFYGIFFTLRYSNQQSLKLQFDSEAYTELETVTIKVPLTVPYAADQHEFRRVDGEFQHEGEHYRLVKQRLASDTLYVVCVKDQQSKRIHQALSDYVKTLADDLGHDKSGHSPGINFSKDFCGSTFSLITHSIGWEQAVVQHGAVKHFIPSYSPSITNPPEGA